MFYAGHAKLHIGAYEQAVAWHWRSIEAKRNYAPAHFGLAAALAQLDRADEAQPAVKAGLALTLTFTIARLFAVYSAFSDRPTFLAELHDHGCEGMRKAGLPE